MAFFGPLLSRPLRHVCGRRKLMQHPLVNPRKLAERGHVDSRANRHPPVTVVEKAKTRSIGAVVVGDLPARRVLDIAELVEHGRQQEFRRHEA